GVEAPFFELGNSASVKDWNRRRKAPAPWGELCCEGIILTVPSGALRKLDDPTELMTWWNTAMACYPELRGEPQPRRPERLVEDIQISAGWMHSGYPVMTHGAEKTEESNAVDFETLSSQGDWGYFHEFGHNAQKSDWTFSGTGEVTCNLFSLYLGERMAGIEPWENSWLESQKDKPAEYFARGSDFEEWKRSPGLALMMYAEIQREFGWDPFKEALRAYLKLAEGERPRSDLEKHDCWLLEISRATRKNLGPYFERWGLPTTAEARAQVADSEAWMPAGY
ncbi:MAG: M60 family metallopeptidase, partial [Planctomycetota bacterium]